MVYLAYTHLRPIEPDTCGGEPQLDVAGVYYRSRALPDASWSTAKRIGHEGNGLQSFRVVNGTIHETFDTGGGLGPVFYGSLRGSTFSSIRIPDAEATSLRIGDDGRPRIAFTTGGAMRYGVVSGERLTTSTIFAYDDVGPSQPVLVLGRGDHAFVSWAAIRGQDVVGCEDTPTPTHEGTWFATDVDGKWATKRLSTDIGSASLALDVVAGRLHATYTDQRGIRYVTRASDGTWSGSRLEVTEDFNATVLRRDPQTGLLLLVGSVSGDDESTSGIFAVTAS